MGKIKTGIKEIKQKLKKSEQFFKTEYRKTHIRRSNLSMKINSSKREYKDYVIDIADSIEKIEKFVGNFSFEEFEKDKKSIYAVVRAIEIIGEAIKNIPTSVKRSH